MIHTLTWALTGWYTQTTYEATPHLFGINLSTPIGVAPEKPVNCVHYYVIEEYLDRSC